MTPNFEDPQLTKRAIHACFKVQRLCGTTGVVVDNVVKSILLCALFSDCI